MTPEDLIATATLSLSGWLPMSSQKPVSGAAQAHAGLVKLVNTHSSGSGGKVNAARILRLELIEEINRISGDVVKDINTDLTKLRENPCVYSIEAEDWSGKKSHLTIDFDNLPAVDDIEAAFSASAAVRQLAPSQQHLLVRAVEAWAELDAIKRDLNYAIEVLNALEIEKLEKLAKTQDAVMAAARRALKQPSIDVFDRVCKTMNMTLHAFKTSLPVAVGHNMSNIELRQVANWFSLLGEDIYRPFPIHRSSPKGSIIACNALWTSYEDAGATLFVLAAWLRSLAVGDADHKRCKLCFRHVQQVDIEADGYVKKEVSISRFYCPEHTNKKNQRRPDIETYIALLYQPKVKALRKKTSEFHLLLPNTELNNLDTSAMEKQANELGVPSELLKPAAVLATQLRKLIPALSPELLNSAGKLFEDMLRVASKPFKQGIPTNKEDLATIEKCQYIAIRWLGWDTFFLHWFGQGVPPYSEKSKRTGKQGISLDWTGLKVSGLNYDPGHPALPMPDSSIWTGAVTSKLVLDLAFHRAWVQAERTLNVDCYINSDKVKDLYKDKASLASIGQTLGVSAEGIRKTLLNANAPVSRNIVQRILPNKLKQLISGSSE